MNKLTLTEKVQLYLDEIKNGRFEVKDNFIVYKAINTYSRNRGVKEGEIIGHMRKSSNMWQCYACINGEVIRVAMSVIMYAYHFGINKVYDKMEIRYKDENRYNYSKDNMINASERFGITDDELEDNVFKRIELILKQIEIGLYYVDKVDGEIYYGATGNNIKKGEKLGYLDEMGYKAYMINLKSKNKNCRIRLHSVLYAYYYGIENIDINKIIHHIDKVKSNNHKENFKQISYCENARLSQMKNVYNSNKLLDTRGKIKYILDKEKQKRYTIDEKKGEIYYFKLVPHDNCSIGQIVGSISNKGYRVISFKHNGIGYNIPLHVIIYYFVNGLDKFDENTVIHHIDGVKQNNSISNLQQITHRLNSIKGNRHNKPLKN